ncbi:MAG: NAD(P)/FAD-dependent oxidoreductase [Actinomycetes bacterium]
MADGSFDVVVVGASLAGCTAATLFARAGLRVALLEAHRDPAHYKRACTHFVQASAVPTLRELGWEEAIAAAGGLPNRIETWTRWGWLRPDPRPGAFGYNIRRSRLDPLVRALTAEEPGVTLLLGHTVSNLLVDGGRVGGVVARSFQGERTFRARLVVGADGRHSRVGRAAGLPFRERPHGRFVYFAEFEGVELRSAGASRMWLLEPDVAYAFPNDGVTVLSVMPAAASLPEFRRAPEAGLLETLRGLPDGPDLAGARRVSPLTGVLHYSCTRRRAAAPGVALAGDAAMTSDYLWGVGCGFAFQSARWLVEATAGAFGSDGDVDAALRRYRRVHGRTLAGHHALTTSFASGRPLNAVERMLFSAAVTDPVTAERLRRYAERWVGPSHLLGPAALARAAVVGVAG